MSISLIYQVLQKLKYKTFGKQFLDSYLLLQLKQKVHKIYQSYQK